MVSWHGKFFGELDYFWNNLRLFAFRNRTIFEFFFISIYSIEQLILIYLTFNANNLNELSFIISIFAIIILTTFAIHKLLMNSRIKFLEARVKDLQQEKFSLESATIRIKKMFMKSVDKVISEDLNSNKDYNEGKVMKK